MRKRKIVQVQKKSYISSVVFLHILKAGALITVAMVAPNALRGFTFLGVDKRKNNDYYPSSINRCATRLWRKGFVEIHHSAEGTIVSITQKGGVELLKYDLSTLSIPRQKPWDGKWRMVFFDIPTTRDKERRVLQEFLKTLEFFPIQKSVYIHPFPCNKQIAYLREILHVPHAVKTATVESIENEEDLKKIYML